MGFNWQVGVSCAAECWGICFGNCFEQIISLLKLLFEVLLYWNLKLGRYIGLKLVFDSRKPASPPARTIFWWTRQPICVSVKKCPKLGLQLSHHYVYTGTLFLTIFYFMKLFISASLFWVPVPNGWQCWRIGISYHVCVNRKLWFQYKMLYCLLFVILST